MKTVYRKILFPVILFLIFYPAQAVQLPPASRLVPPETAYLVEIEDVDAFKEKLESTSFYKLYNDPAMKAFFDRIKESLEEGAKEQDENNLYRMFYELEVLPKGRLAVAGILEGSAEQEQPLLFITQWGSDIEKIKTALNKVVEKNIEMGGHSKPAEDFHGVSIETVIDEQDSEFSYCFIDDCFMGMLGSGEALKFAVAHIEGAGSPSLADQSDFASAFAAAGSEGDLTAYVNIEHILKASVPPEAADQAKQTLSQVGLDNVTALCCSLSLADQPGNVCGIKGILKINGEKKGVCKLLDFTYAPIRTPEFISSLAYSVSFINLDIKAAAEEIINVLGTVSPMYASLACSPLLPPADDGRPGPQLKADIIDHLGSHVITISNLDGPLSDEPAVTKSLFAVAAANPRQLERSLARVHGELVAPEKPELKRELLGHTIYIIDVAALFSSPGADEGQQPFSASAQKDSLQGSNPAFTVTDTHVIVGPVSAVAAAVRTMEDSSAESVTSKRWFGTVKDALPSRVGIASLQDDVTAAHIFWNELKASAKKSDGSFNQLGLGLSSDTGLTLQMAFPEGGPVDFSLLPDFDVVKKYFNLSAFYAVSRPEGVFFEWKEVPAPGGD